MSFELSTISTKRVRNQIRPTGVSSVMYGYTGPSSFSVAQGFVNRFVAPKDYYGFDIVFPALAANATNISVSCGKSPALVGTYSAISPQIPNLNGSPMTSIAMATGDQYNPNFLISDMVNLSGVAGEIIEIRYDVTAGTVYYSGNTITDSTSDPIPEGCTPTISGQQQSASVITGNPAINCLSLNVTLNSMCFVRFYTKAKTYSVLHCGDSICKGEAGNISGQGKYSPLWIASQIDSRISPMVFGVGGQSQNISLKKTVSIAKNLKPNICLIPAYSPNDVSFMTASLGGVIRAINELLNVGIIPAIITPNPWSYTGAGLTVWQKIRSDAIEIASDFNIPLIDYSTVLEDPNVAGQMKSEFFGSAGDNNRLHPNGAGKLAEANAIVDGLSKYFVY